MNFTIQPDPITRTRNSISISNIQSDNISTNNLGQSSGSTINVTSPNIVMGDTDVTTLVSSGPVSLASIADPTSITSPVNGMVIYNSTTNKIQVYSTSAWQTVASE